MEKNIGIWKHAGKVRKNIVLSSQNIITDDINKTLLHEIVNSNFFSGYTGQEQNSCVGWNNFVGRFFFSFIYCTFLSFFSWKERTGWKNLGNE